MAAKPRALLSVFDKSDIVEFAQHLVRLGFDIISTGGTAQTLTQANIPVIHLHDLTGYPEMLSGRVKSLHPKIHAGILAQLPIDHTELTQANIHPISLVVVNLYPFSETCQQQDSSLEQAIEHIDIGGHTLIRAAAKNFQRVGVVIDPGDYAMVIHHYQQHSQLPLSLRTQLALKAFAQTAQYEQAICYHLTEKVGASVADSAPPTAPYWQQVSPLRYGENPHQPAYIATHHNQTQKSLAQCQPWQGKAMSYNNYLDAQAGIEALQILTEPTCVIIKHGTPCGIASHTNIHTAYQQAWRCDSQSAFGGIVACNRCIDGPLATTMINQQFIEVLIAPDFTESAATILQQKPNIRCVSCAITTSTDPHWEFRSIDGGTLIQQSNIKPINPSQWQVVSAAKPDDDSWNELQFAWKAIRTMKSNATIITQNSCTIGIGSGQVSRIESAQQAIAKARTLQTSQATMASDGFFPFDDIIQAAAKADIKQIIQPGGSKSDAHIIDAANQAGIVLVFTGHRHFKH